MRKPNPQKQMITKRIITTALLSCALLAPSLRADGWQAFLNVFNNNSGSAGDYIFGSGWALEDVRTTLVTDVAGTTFGDQLRLEPNYNTYTNSLGGNNGDRAFWTNSSDGGVTAGPLGNKFVEANSFVESIVGTSSVNFRGVVTGYTLDPAYTASAFIKVLDQNAGYFTAVYAPFVLTTGASFSIDVDLSAHQGKILQTGFLITGVNANISGPALGSVSVTVIPEPSSFAAIFGIAAVAFAATRRRRC
jgi:hypothetical protein